nr:N-6 DNA methylase [Planctomycetota bacterium]
MTPLNIDKIRQVDDFESLIVFLRDELEWPLEAEDIENLYFDYDPEELGLSEDVAVNINFIKQLRPLAENQPWGIFYIDFEPKRLPVVVLRKVLQKLVVKKRPTSQKSNLPGWQMNDLLFINSFGQQDERAITFAHFHQEVENQSATLKVIGWDGQDTPLHIDRCLNELGHLRFDPDVDVEAWKENWAWAFTTRHRHTITTSKRLAQELAQLARTVRIYAEQILRYETEGGRFKKTMAKFKTALIHDLTEDDFADMYAQTIAYGLLYTAIRGHVSGEVAVVAAERVRQLVLPTNPFLKEVMESFFDVGARRWSPEAEQLTGIDFDELGINDIISTLKDERTDFDAILRDFGNKNPNEDPVIHFYELFLKEYDKQKRKSRGVYYTPQPVVSFIVRSVHEVLKCDFNLPLGLADTSTWAQVMKDHPNLKLPKGISKDEYFVQVLDPATGTGTFLVETIDLIYKTMTDYWQSQGKSEAEITALWNRYVPDCLLPRVFGFELMMAPYAIAHMKIGIKLYETGYGNFEQDKKRVQVFLTNTLEEAVDTSGYLDTLDPALAVETEYANTLKKSNAITVIIGNPPYSGLSFNINPWIDGLLKGQIPQGPEVRSYYEVDGQPLAEKKVWLQDDYVKFIRYSQWRLDNVGAGIHGFITNHAYLDNPTFRGMRQALIESFNSIEIVDLHGNAKKRERCPDGSPDANVFDIQQGVGIALFRNIPSRNESSICHAELWGSREHKYTMLRQETVGTSGFCPLTPNSPHYFFVPYDETNREEYETHCKISDIMKENNVGIVTARDALTVHNAKADVWRTVNDFASLPTEHAREKYSLGKDVQSWKVHLAQADINAAPLAEDRITPILYRPF